MRSRSGFAGVLSGKGFGASLLFTLLALALPASALAQATRTWVSGVGDDANPCSRTAPCKTWAGAISKTAAGGEIDALDPGGFGALTITKSLTIDGGGGQVASTLVAGTDGIVVNPTSASDRVTIRNLRIHGLAGNGSNLPGAGLNGIKFLAGSVLRLEHVSIFGFAHNGVLDTNPGVSKLVVSDSSIANNFGDGLLLAPGTSGRAIAVVENSYLEDNSCGLVVTTMSTGSGTCGIGSSVVATRATATAVRSSMSVNDNDGVLASGANALSVLSGNLIAANSLGLEATNSGQNIFLCGNILGGNGTQGSPTSSVSTNCT